MRIWAGSTAVRRPGWRFRFDHREKQMVQGSAHHPLQIIAGNGGTKLNPTLGLSASYSCDQTRAQSLTTNASFIGDRQSLGVVGAVVRSYGYAVGMSEGNGDDHWNSHFNQSAGLSSASPCRNHCSLAAMR
jgi:hypothetical protein